MHLITLMIENMNSVVDGSMVSNVAVISDLKEVTAETLKPIAEKLCDLACERQFMKEEK